MSFHDNVVQMLRDWEATELEAWQLHDAAVGDVLEGGLTVLTSGGWSGLLRLPCARCALQELRNNIPAIDSVATENVFLAHKPGTAHKLNPTVAAACLDYLKEIA